MAHDAIGSFHHPETQSFCHAPHSRPVQQQKGLEISPLKARRYRIILVKQHLVHARSWLGSCSLVPVEQRNVLWTFPLNLEVRLPPLASLAFRRLIYSFILPASGRNALLLIPPGPV